MSRKMIKYQLDSAHVNGACRSSQECRILLRRRMPAFRLFCQLTTVFALLLTIVGCSKKEFDDMVNKAKEDLDKVQKTADKELSKAIGSASEELGMSGKASMQLEQPVNMGACYVFLIKQSPERPNVLKMQSYASPESESFPSLFIQAQVSQSSLEELVGKEISAQVFVQAKQGEEVWYTAPAESIRVKISGLDGNILTAELAGGKLQSTVSGNSVDVAGKIEALVQ